MAKKTRRFKVNQERHRTVTAVGRLSFPNLFEAKAYVNPETGKEEGKRVFKCDLIFDSTEDLKESYRDRLPSVAQAISNAKKDFWGSDKSAWPKLTFPWLKKGDDNTNKDGEVRKGYEGKVFITAKTGEKFPPKLVLADNSAASEEDLYAGCYVRAQVTVSPWQSPIGSGISLYLSGIQKIKDGERFGGNQLDFDSEEPAGAFDEDEGDDGDDFDI